MAHHPGLPFDPDLLHPDLWVADIVYRPLETELLRRAREAGCRTLDGGGMVVFQAAASFELFTELEPDRERMLRHFARLVEAPALAAG
jgi:shikimate dehydrogenase